MAVAVTGASGFVGSAMVSRLANDPAFEVRACYRRAPEQAPDGCEVRIVPELSDEAAWQQAFAGAGAVVHTAARAHVMNERADDALAAYRRVNVDGTLAVARAAAAAGVGRFVFLSSIKVNGESTPIDRPFRETDPPVPEDAYGISKREAEDVLHELMQATGLEVVVLRAPLIVGPHAKGNVARLRRWIARGLPLPLGGIENLRSLIDLDSLCEATVAALTREAAAGRTYLLADRDLSTPDFVRELAAGLGKPARLLPVPVGLLRFGGRLSGRVGEVDRLVGSLRVDASAAVRDLGLVRRNTR